MLAVSALRGLEETGESFESKEDETSVESLFENFDFDDLFVDGDIFPDLEMDLEMLAGFSVNGYDLEVNGPEKEKKEVEGKREEISATKRGESPADSSVSGKGNQSKKSQGKRKVKVDWTPELHRRFVQAVEQLGVDKAVPSRILELMGIDCLNRHNIASHLQKYRSHKKHLLAREAEAASWSQRRQMYGGGKTEGNPWLPAVGFPPPSPIQPFRPLHVWGHPKVDHPLVHVWPKHHLPSHSPPPWVAPQPPPSDPSYWHHHHLHLASKERWIQPAPTQGTPCFPQSLTNARFSAPPVPGIPPCALYKQDISMALPQSHAQLKFDFQPSKECIDAIIGDALTKPLSPLPLGLKPPSPEGVLAELQRQGISKLPPTCAL